MNKASITINTFSIIFKNVRYYILLLMYLSSDKNVSSYFVRATFNNTSISGGRALGDAYISNNKNNRNDPRSELKRDITSGEEAWLRATRNSRHATSQASTKRRSASRQNTAFRNSPRGTNNKNVERNVNHELPSNISKEIQTLSHQHGLLNPSNQHHDTIDRVTMAQIHKSADNGSTESAYFIGLFYLYGLGNLQIDVAKAVHWLRIAAGDETNNSNRYNQFQDLDSSSRHHGSTTIHNTQYRQPNPDAQCALGIILYYGVKDEIGIDRKSATRWFYRASMDHDHPRGHWLLGRALYGGMKYEDIGILHRRTDSHQEEEEWGTLYRLTANGFSLGGQDFEESVRLFELAAKADIPEAIHQLALMFEYNLIERIDDANNGKYNSSKKNKLSKSNYINAVELYKRAARLGSSPESLYNLGLMHVYERGMPLNYAVANDYFRQAASYPYNHAPSMRYMGLLALYGHSQPDNLPDPSEALFWFELCMEQQWTTEGFTTTLKDRSNIFSDGTRGSSILCVEEVKELQKVLDEAESVKKILLQNSTDDIEEETDRVEMFRF